MRTPDGLPVQKHLEQLLFYSALLFDNYSIARISGVVVGLTGDLLELSITPSDAAVIADTARQAIHRANSLLSADLVKLALPSSTSCSHCSLQAMCPGFRNAQPSLSLDGDQMLLEGEVLNLRHIGSSPMVELTILDRCRKANVTVGIPVHLANELDGHRSILISNLRQHGRSFAWSHESRIYAMTEPRDLSLALWKAFGDDIASGDPVFFCFSRELLGEELGYLGLTSETLTNAVCEAARACFYVDGTHVWLQGGALSADASGFSLSIVLVCQQVLAVEEMVREGGSYSENAYFPRLRALMSPELAAHSANPFRFHEFERIWQTFAKEVRTISGSSDDTITFSL